jgi:replication-associated recombination protein RarA
MNDNTPWVIKYAPSKVDEMVMNQSLKDMFNDMINNKTLSNMTLYGVAGSGKTTLAKLIPKALDYYVHFQSCSADGSIDMIKTTILNYCQVMTEANRQKIVILDEADQISQQGQMALRNIIVDSLPDTRFILTCNYLDKIIPALQSRCTPIKIEFSVKDVAEYVIRILTKEQIKFTKASITAFINHVIKKQYPDIRSIIERLQLSSQSGELVLIDNFNNTVENEVINFILNTSDVKAIREYLLSNEDKFSGDYIKLAGELFNAVTNDTKKMLIIADYLYKMSIVFDKEIQFTAMIIELKKN